MNNSGITRGFPKTPFSFPSTVNQLQSRDILSYQSCHSLPFLSSKRSVSVLVLVIPSLKLKVCTWKNEFETQEEKLVSQLPTIDFHASWATLLSASVMVSNFVFSNLITAAHSQLQTSSLRWNSWSAWDSTCAAIWKKGGPKTQVASKGFVDRTWVFLSMVLISLSMFIICGRFFWGLETSTIFLFVSDIASRDRLEIQVFARVCSKMMGLGGDVDDMLVNLKANRNIAPYVNKI